jgi:hypothetical protein
MTLRLLLRLSMHWICKCGQHLYFWLSYLCMWHFSYLHGIYSLQHYSAGVNVAGAVAHCFLQAFDQYLRDVTVKLNRKVEDLDDVRYVMGVLREVRETEAKIETLITPIDDMYSLLMRCGMNAFPPQWAIPVTAGACLTLKGSTLVVLACQIAYSLAGEHARPKYNGNTHPNTSRGRWGR